MFVAGLDLGSTTAKAVIMTGGEIAGAFVTPSNAHPQETARRALEAALREAGLESLDQVSYVVSTGYGRRRIPYAGQNASEITCHAKGAHWAANTIRTVIDIGGQDCKVISVTPSGTVGEFVMNDRCAAGTGRFFEGIARGLGCELAGISDLTNQGEEPCNITNQCSVFAESEVVTLVNEGVDIRNIISGINISVAKRLKAMAVRVGVVEDVAVTGGCSKNEGLVKAINDLLKIRVKSLPLDPQIIGAVGAALLAAEELGKQSRAAGAAASG